MSWFVVGGIAIGATAGAIVGSKKGGDDVWKGALIGGAIGGTAGAGAGAISGAGVFGGIGAEGAAAAAAPEAAGILGAEGVAGGSGLALGGAGLETGGAMAGGAGLISPTVASVAPTAAAAAPTGIAAAAPEAAAFGSSALPTGAAALPGEGAAFGSTGGATVGSTGGAWNLGGTAGNAAGSAAGNPLTSGFKDAMNWVGENKMATGLGLLALSGVLNKNNSQTFNNPQVTPAGYSLSPDFKPSRVNPQDYWYTPNYSESGVSERKPSSAFAAGEKAAATSVGMASGGSVDWGRKAKEYAAMTDSRAKSEAPPEYVPSYVGSPGIFVDDDADTATQDPLTAARTRMAKIAGRSNVRLGAMDKAMPIGVINMVPVSMASKDQEGRGYADGGIAQTNPNPRMMQSGPADVDFMGGDMYPQSQIHRSYYATPTQAPTSAQEAMASYEPKVNQMTGQPVANMAGGGLASILGGALMPPLAQAAANNPVQSAVLGGALVPPVAQANNQFEAQIVNQMTGVNNKPLVDEYGMPIDQSKQYASGGIASLGGYAAGGNPHLLRGPGDGMSDDIPATIANKQPARLADGEFVVPADVVSGLGNGSTEAGAKKLHQMMDKVRVDRTGTKKQGKKINPDKYVQGMAKGGKVKASKSK